MYTKRSSFGAQTAQLGGASCAAGVGASAAAAAVMNGNTASAARCEEMHRLYRIMIPLTRRPPGEWHMLDNIGGRRFHFSKATAVRLA